MNKKVLLKVLQNSQENISAESFNQLTGRRPQAYYFIENRDFY